MNINELQVGGVIKYQRTGDDKQYKTTIVKIYPDKFLVKQDVNGGYRSEYYINKSFVVSRVVETTKTEEIPVTQPMAPLTFTLIPHSCRVDIAPFWTAFGYTTKTQITGCTLEGDVDLTVPFRLDIDPNKKYKVTIEEV